LREGRFLTAGIINMEFQDIIQRVRDIVRGIIASDKSLEVSEIQVADEDSLIDGGLIDSILAVVLVEELMMNFDIIINAAELSLENFDSIPRISQLVSSKLNGEGC
jgi:acyl carrier protein